MAVLESIRNLFVPAVPREPETIIPAPPAEYSIRPLTLDQLKDVLRLNIRCFRNGDNYTKHTFDYLLNSPEALSYRVTTEKGEMAAFAFVMITENGSAHLTTIGVAPEHRRRGLAKKLLSHVELAAASRDIGTVVLEVRIGNREAINLYCSCGYHIVQRISKYYVNGEDCFLMMKAVTP